MAPVVLFFVLSGFVLARSLERNASALAFFRSRIFRLVPAAAATVLLFTALYWQTGFSIGYRASFNCFDILFNALMIRSDINGVMWSMTVECLAAPLILVCFAAHKSHGPSPLLALSAILIGLSFYGPYVHLLGGFTNLGPLYAFVTGVLLHFAATRTATPQYAALWGAGAIALFIWCGLRKQTAPVLCLESLSAGALIYLIAVDRTARVFAFLDWGLARFFGRVSYSFYLLHPLGLALAERTAPRSAVALFLFAVAYTAPMAWLSWRLIELPFMRYGRSKHAQEDIADNRRLHVSGLVAAPAIRTADDDVRTG
jgi:peptidoglycan/LPS O-acetylase OafA/YrhL